MAFLTLSKRKDETGHATKERDVKKRSGPLGYFCKSKTKNKISQLSVATETREEDPVAEPLQAETPPAREVLVEDLNQTTAVENVIDKTATRSFLNNTEIVFEEFGDDPLMVYKIRAHDVMPTPKSPDEVIVKVKASSISLKDCNIRRGMWHETISLPNTPGFDIVGTLAYLGENVVSKGVFRVGDPVAAIVRTGGNARYCRVPASNLIKVPGTVDSAEAVSIVSTYITAYQALHRVRPFKEKETLEGCKILVTGGNGPVGQAVIELAKRAGCAEVFATAHEKYHTQLRSKGATPLPLDHEEWLPIVEGKMDITIDGICQDNYVSPRASLNSNGYLVVIGMTLLTNTEEMGWCGMPFSVMCNTVKSNYFMTRTKVYCSWKSFHENPYEFKHDIEYLFGLLQKRQIRPKVSKRVPLTLVAHTQKDLEVGKVDGIAVCKPWK